MGEFDGYTLVPTSNLRRIADELGMEGGIYAPKLRREVLAYIDVSPSLFAEAQPPAAGVDELRAAFMEGRSAGVSAACASSRAVENADEDWRVSRTLVAALRTGGGA